MQTSNIKEGAPLIWAEIEKAKHILLHCHPSPDQDSVGSSLAMKLALESKGKRATLIIGDSPVPKWAKFLPGSDSILAKNYFDLDASDFDLFLILDGNAWNRVSALAPIDPPAGLRTVVIDHHQGEGCGEINLIVPDHPATASILSELFKEWGISLSREMALCLLVGLHADTGGFKYPRTTARIFELAAQLAAVAPDFTQVLNHIYGVNSLGSRRIIGHVLLTAEIILNGQAAVGTVSQADLARLGVTSAEASNAGLSTMIRDIDGVKVSVVLVEEDDGTIKISSRSADGERYDVVSLMKQFGGGGHRAAAGATTTGSLAEVKEKIIAQLSAWL